MEIFMIPFLFGMSSFLMLLYFGEDFMEKRMLSRRLRLLQESEGFSSVPTDEIHKTDFSHHKRSERSKVENQPAFLFGAALWVGAGAVLLKKAGFDLAGMITVLVIIPILVFRIGLVVYKKMRVARLERELPGALDLMVICMEAGLALNSTLNRVSQELEDSPLGKELRQVANEVSSGLPMEDALQGLAKRTKIDDLNPIVSAVVQAEKMGTSLADTLRVQAETLRDKNKMAFREKINRVPIKILFPLVFFLFPALFVVILGPSMIHIMRTLKGAT